MKNKKVLFLTSLLAVATLAGCGAKTSSQPKNDGVPTSMIIPEASKIEAVENNKATYPSELLVNHRIAAMMVNETLQLEATEQFGYDAKNVKFEVKDATIATVSENGLITGLKAGETEIVVTDKNNPEFKRTVPVSVYDPVDSSDVKDITDPLKSYEAEHPVTEVVQRKRITRTFSKRPYVAPEEPEEGAEGAEGAEEATETAVPENPEPYVQFSRDYSDEMMVFSVDDAYLRILETDSEIRTTNGGVDFTNYDWIFHTNRYFDTLVYHQTGDVKTFYSAPTQDFMDGERKVPLYEILDNLFTVGHTFFENQLDNAGFKDIVDIAENDYGNVEDKKVGSLGDGSLFVHGVLTFKDSLADNDDEKNYGIPVGTPTPTTQDSTWIIRNNRVEGIYFYLVQNYVIDDYEYQMIMDIDIQIDPISADRHEIYVPIRDEYQQVDRLFDI